MDIAVAHTIGLLGVAILVAIIARRLSLPYTVGLVVTGIGLAMMHLETGALLTHDFIFDLILPPLLFEAAISIHWRSLTRDLLPVLTLSTLGVIVSAAFVAAGMSLLLSWPTTAALIFGVLIAATDPIAVIALFKDIGVTGRLGGGVLIGIACGIAAIAIAWRTSDHLVETALTTVAALLVASW
jgi:monovalent cation:H+ antiporter, CPA1 family